MEYMFDVLVTGFWSLWLQCVSDDGYRVGGHIHLDGDRRNNSHHRRVSSWG